MSWPRLLTLLVGMLALPAMAGVRIKDLTRPSGAGNQAVVGYGLVVGLSGTGDSARNLATQQSVANLLQNFGLQVAPEAIAARDVAAVLVSAELPETLRRGDRADINVAALGDARSLAGGTLLMTPLMSTDHVVLASAQGPLSVGGYRFEQSGTSGQKNFPTTGSVPNGAQVSIDRDAELATQNGELTLLLKERDNTTAVRIAEAIARRFPSASARALDAGRVVLQSPGGDGQAVTALLAAIENLEVEPSSRARVVVNERTGTVVSGGAAWISAVSVAQGNLRVSISERARISQPGGVLVASGDGIRTAVVPEARVHIDDGPAQALKFEHGTSIAELVTALRDVGASARDVISILQAIERAGALHAELVVQ